MKKILFRNIALICVCVLTFASVGCGKKVDAPAESTEAPTAEVEVKPGTTIEDGVLLVGISSSPYIIEDEDGKIEGFEVDVAKAIGELTFLNVRFVKMDYNAIYAQLDTGSFDCVMSGVEITEAVDKVYDFSAAYYTDDEGRDIGAVVKSGNNRLLNVLNKSIAILKNNGRLDELYEKWFAVPEESEENG